MRAYLWYLGTRMAVYMAARCKFCKSPFESYRELRFHCAVEHQAEFHKVTEWLGKTVQPKLEVLEKLAAEGMVGHAEVPNDE
jgi:DNA relaxase NicK